MDKREILTKISELESKQSAIQEEIAELKEYSKEFVVCEDNFCVYYDNECGAIDYDFLHWDQSNNLYFPSREIAQQAVEAVGEDRVKKYYLGVK